MKVKEFIKNFWEVLNRREMLILPGHLAFSFILSIVPILTLIGYGAAVLNLSIGFIEEFITKAFGSTISQMIIPIVSVSGLSFSFFVTLFIGFFTASSGASAIIITSNMIYGIEDKGYIYRKIKALVMTVFIVFLFLFILIFPLFGNKIVELVTYVNLNAKVTEELKKIFDFLQGPFALFIIFLFIKIIYAMAPDVRIPSKNVNYGAIFTSIGWLVITWIYSFYINHYAHYSVFYGGLANLVILLLWFYLLANIFVIGMALNYRKSETKKIK